MDIHFSKVNSPEAFKKVVSFLRGDVESNGGSASMTISMHGNLRQITVCKVPCGTILINQESSQLEAWACMLQDID